MQWMYTDEDEINEWVKNIKTVKWGMIQVVNIDIMIRRNSLFDNEQNKSNRYNTTRLTDNQIT